MSSPVRYVKQNCVRERHISCLCHLRFVIPAIRGEHLANPTGNEAGLDNSLELLPPAFGFGIPKTIFPLCSNELYATRPESFAR
jgi:hypothetical protein